MTTCRHPSLQVNPEGRCCDCGELARDIPREFCLWPCPDPATCPAREVSGHSRYYCPFGALRDAREEG